MIVLLKQHIKKLEQKKQQLEQTIKRLYSQNADLLNQLERTHA